MEDYCLIDSQKIDELKEIYIRAIHSQMEDRYRKGDLIELPALGDVIVLGDLHGNRQNISKVIKAAELDIHPDRHLILQEPTHTYEVSEDRSFLLIADIAELKKKFPHQVHTILGNHELSEFTGRELLKGGICYNILFKEGMRIIYGKRFEEIRELIYDFMKTMPLACVAPNKIFISHSTPDLKFIPQYSLDFFRTGTGNPELNKTLVEKLVWSRDLTPVAADAFAARVQCEILIVGHTPCKRGYNLPNHRHIILDSKNIFGTSLHFRLDHCYTYQNLSKKIQYINPKAVQEWTEKHKNSKEEQLQEDIL